MLYSMGLSIHMHGDCERRKQSHIGIIIRLIQMEPYFVCLDFPNLAIGCLSNSVLSLVAGSKEGLTGYLLGGCSCVDPVPALN